MDITLNFKEIAKSVFIGMNNKDFDLLQSNMSENIIFDFPGVKQMNGIKKVLSFIKTLLIRQFKSLILQFQILL